jgi:hypothetical protein
MKRKKIFRLALILVLVGMLPTIPPVDAIALEGVWFPLRDEVSGNFNDDGIMIDLALGHYATHANLGEQNGRLYYEFLAYNPSGNPTTITWGMIRVNPNGILHFDGLLDSYTSAWLKSYGLTGTTFSVRPI